MKPTESGKRTGDFFGKGVDGDAESCPFGLLFNINAFSFGNVRQQAAGELLCAVVGAEVTVVIVVLFLIALVAKVIENFQVGVLLFK